MDHNSRHWKKDTGIGDEMFPQTPRYLVQRSVKRRTLKCYGHVTRSFGLAKTILQGTVQGWRRRVRQETMGRQNQRVDHGLALNGTSYYGKLRTARSGGRWLYNLQWCPNGQPDYRIDKITRVTRPGTTPAEKAGIEPRVCRSQGGRLNHVTSETVSLVAWKKWNQSKLESGHISTIQQQKMKKMSLCRRHHDEDSYHENYS